MKTKKTADSFIKNRLFTVAVIHLVLVAVYIFQSIAYDAAKLITPEVLLQRWAAAVSFGVVSIIIIYLARSKEIKIRHQQYLVWLLILAGILFATFNIYTQRGMASRAVILFVIPIITATLLSSRLALITTAFLSIAAYTLAAVAYFVNFFNEGYKIELYGEILFYSAVYVIVASLMWAVLRHKS